MGKIQKLARKRNPKVVAEAWVPSTLRSGNRILIVFPFGIREIPFVPYDPEKFLKKGK